MRRGSALIENTIVQLVIFAAVAIMVASFAWSAINMELFDQRAFAADNTMLVESMHAIDDATVVFVYPLSDLRYTVGLTEQARVTVSNADAGSGAVASRQFITDADITIHPARFTPLLYEWVKTPTDLSLRQLAFSTSCPPPTDPTAWDGRLLLAMGDPVAQDVLEVLISRTDRIEYTDDDRPAAASRLRIEGGDTILITHSGEPIMDRLACLSTVQLAGVGTLEGVVVDEDLPANTFVVSIPDDLREPAIQSLRCSYKRLFSEDDTDGCA